MKHTGTIFWLSAMALALSSCSAIPAKLERSSALGASSRPFQGETLHSLIEISLEQPNQGNSAHALGYVVESWLEERNGSARGTVVPDASSETDVTFRVRFDANGPAKFLPSYFDELSPAVDYRVKKLERYTREGFGTPMKALRENEGSEPIERYFPPEAITREVTAIIRPGARRGNVQDISIELLCAHYYENVVIQGRQVPLAGDYTVALAALLERAKGLAKSEVGDVFRGSPKRDPQLYMMEPYDPNKEVLIMIHGLLSSPLTWAELTNVLRSDREIRRRYQIWHYLYNTSAPALYSGRILRTQYRELRSNLDPGLNDRATRNTTLVTHSMGGIVARSLITDPGDAFWKVGFTQSFTSLKLSPEDRAALQEAFFWKPEPSVKRVIFIAVPHRGSKFADNVVGRIGRGFVKPPSQFQAFYDRISSANPGAFTEAYADLGEGKLDSVSALSPQQPTLQILPDLPLGYPVNLHSIIGDRGRPGPVEESSDGIVEYWSSHLENVESEAVVPYPHALLHEEEVIEEVKRVLELR